MADLKREDFFQVLREGGTVVYNGFLIKSVADIPTEAELSIGDAEAEAAAKSNILSEIEALKAQLAQLKDSDKQVRKAGSADAETAVKS